MRAGYLATDMSRMLGWPASTISRLESGLRSYQAGNIAIYLARAKTTPQELDDLVALDRRPDDGYQVRSHPAGFPDDVPLITMLDTGSHSITIYNRVDIPRQLQIEPYIRETLTRNGYEDGPALDTAVRTRLARPTLLTIPDSLTVYLHETALLESSRYPTLKHEQILHLLIVSSLARHHIHVVPATSDLTDIHAGFTLYRHNQHQPVVHHQQPTTSLFLEDDHNIAFYVRQLERIASQALTHQKTRDWLTSNLTKLDAQVSRPRN
ncbi:hypothetical protein B1H26_18540 [Amycolatopsis sp. BJA-103]|nr:hypothetical protein BKN51_15975 [Amycolatopsis sp. BJA-103]PNE16979.1 hypothetical protein B1H26_18540 [Amycolatopsis sp. BJA-103]